MALKQTCPALEGRVALFNNIGRLGLCCNDPCNDIRKDMSIDDATEREKFILSQGYEMEGFSFCQICRDTEESGNESMRQVLSKSSDVFDLTVNVGNVCNLRCAMCRPEYSYLLSQDISALPDDLSVHYRIKKMNGFSIADGKKTELESFLRSIKSPVNLTFIGGEPLADIEIMEWMLHLLRNNDQIRYLKINTNLSFNNRRTDQLIEHPKTMITASIEGYGDSYEWGRWGSSWLKIQENVRKYRSSLGNRFAVHTVMHAISILGDEELTAFLSDLGIKQSKVMLVEPEFLQLKVLTPEERKRLSVRENMLEHDPVMREKFEKYMVSLSKTRGKEIPSSIANFFDLGSK